MGYYEGEIGNLCCNNGYNNGGSFGNDSWGWIVGLAIIGALFGGNGFGFGGGNRGVNGGFGGDCVGWQLGRLATTNDVASGFSTSEIMSDLNDIILGQAQMQNFINQGFSGLNQTVTNGFAGVNNAICTLGYQQAQLVNGLSRELADCCCTTQRAIDSVKLENERNTCSIINASNANTRAILDFLTTEKISALQAENSGLKAQISNDRQSAFIIDALAPKCPSPAYVVQPPQQVTFPTNCCGNVAYAGYGACGASVQ